MFKASQETGITTPKVDISRNSGSPGLGIGATTKLNGGLVDQLSGLTVDVDDNGTKVKVFCE